MDKTTTFAKTPKGQGETVHDGESLSAELQSVLHAIQGPVNLAELLARLKGVTAGKLLENLNVLEARGYIREFVEPVPDYSDDFDDTDDDVNDELEFSLTPPPSNEREEAAEKAKLKQRSRKDGHPSAEGQRKSDYARLTANSQLTLDTIAPGLTGGVARKRPRPEKRSTPAGPPRKTEAELAAMTPEERAAYEEDDKARRKAVVARIREEALEKYRKDMEARAMREAEEKLRREQEERERILAEAAARKRAEEDAKREAERRAELEAARLAELRERLATEEQVRRATEELARIEAIQREQREAAKREAEIQAAAQREFARQRAEEEARLRREEEQRQEEARLAQIEAEFEALLETEEDRKRKAWEAVERKVLELQQNSTVSTSQPKSQPVSPSSATPSNQSLDLSTTMPMSVEVVPGDTLISGSTQSATAATEQKSAKDSIPNSLGRSAPGSISGSATGPINKSTTKSTTKSTNKPEPESDKKSEKRSDKKPDNKSPSKTTPPSTLKPEVKNAPTSVPVSARSDTRQEPKLGSESAPKDMPDTVLDTIADTILQDPMANRAISIADERIVIEEEPYEAPSAARPKRDFGRVVRRWARNGGLLLLVAVIVGVLAIPFLEFDEKRVELQRALRDDFHQPVKIGGLSLKFFPQPYWQLHALNIGNDSEIRVPEVKARIELPDLLEGRLRFSTLELQSPVIKSNALGALLVDHSQNLARFEHVVLTDAKLGGADLDELPFNARVEFDNNGNWKKIFSDALDNKLRVNLTHDGSSVRVSLDGEELPMPWGKHLPVDKLSALGNADQNGLTITHFDAVALRGAITGKANLKWGDSFALTGSMTGKHLNAGLVADGLITGGFVDADASFNLSNKTVGSLLAVPHLRARFGIVDGILLGADLGNLFRDAGASGQTTFAELKGNFALDGNVVQLHDMRLKAGALSAAGRLDIMANKTISGGVAIDIRTPSNDMHTNLMVSGNTLHPEFSQ